MVRPPNRLLSAVPRDQYQQLHPHIEAVRLERGQTVLAAGERLTHAYFPRSGVLSLIVASGEGESVEVATVGCEGVVGLSLVLDGGVSPYDVICQVPGEAMRLPAGVFRRLFEDSPAARGILLRYTLALLNQVVRTAACNRLHSAEQRLARWLLLCHDRVGTDTIAITHEFLASLLGVHRPAVTIAAGVLQTEGLIRYARGIVTILDRPGLEAAACDDYEGTVSEYKRLLG